MESSASVLDDIMAIPAKSIPISMLRNAQGIVIVPNMLKGGFVVGVRHGRGVLVVRDENGAWQAPSFVTMTGGSVGFQAGVQASDVILVFKTQKSVNGLMSGKFTIGADAAAAAGPVGRQAAAATDTQLGAEIYSYSRSRGLFAGVALDGSSLQIDTLANNAFYQAAGVGPDGRQFGPGVGLPPSAIQLLETVLKYTDQANEAGQLAPGGAGFAAAASPVEMTRQQLVASAQHLFVMLDDNWKRYLALPREVYVPNSELNSEALNATITRYNQVINNPQYRALSSRVEFQTTLTLLKQLATQVAQPAATINLPAPPAGAATARPNGSLRY